MPNRAGFRSGSRHGAAALQWLREAGAQRFYWKYCSTFDLTPRGNIGPVADALMEVLGTNQTVYCPAFPENGRSLFMGNLFVGEQPLAESPMKDHPLTPMSDFDIDRLLQPQVTFRVGLANRKLSPKGPQALRRRLAQLRAEDVAHVIVDAITDDDLWRHCRGLSRHEAADWRQRAGDVRCRRIWMRLLGLLKRRDAFAPPGRRGPAIILSGSCSAVTHRQVVAYLSQGRPGLQTGSARYCRTGADAAVDWLSAQAPAAAPSHRTRPRRRSECAPRREAWD